MCMEEAINPDQAERMLVWAEDTLSLAVGAREAMLHGRRGMFAGELRSKVSDEFVIVLGRVQGNRALPPEAAERLKQGLCKASCSMKTVGEAIAFQTAVLRRALELAETVD